MELIAAAHVDSPFEFAFRAGRRRRARSSCGSSTRRWATPTRRRSSRASTGASSPASASAFSVPMAPASRRCSRRIAGELPPHARRALRRAGTAPSAISRSTSSNSSRDGDRRCGMLQRSSPAAREQELRDFLGGFDFRGDMASSRRSARFSGGEKARLALALIVRARRNLLLLDEPTNHLDIEMREALDRGAAGLRRRAGRRRARSPPAARDHRRAVARRRRQRRAVRRRPRRLPRLGARPRAGASGSSPSHRGGGLAHARGSQGAETRRGGREAAAADARRPLVARQAALEIEMGITRAKKSSSTRGSPQRKPMAKR